MSFHVITRPSVHGSLYLKGNTFVDEELNQDYIFRVLGNGVKDFQRFYTVSFAYSWGPLNHDHRVISVTVNTI